MISDMNQGKCHIVFHVESKRIMPIGAESGMVATRGWMEVRGMQRCWSKGTKFQLNTGIIF
jgi:hypothetical protein